MNECPICHSIEETLCYGCLRRLKEKAEAELATKMALLNDLANIVEDFRNALETIVNNYDIDPRAEAREALEGKPRATRGEK